MKNYIKMIIVMALFMGAFPLSSINTSFNNNIKQTPEKIEKTFNTKSGLKVDIKLKIGAEIEVVGWDKEVVSVVVETSGRDADRITYDINESSEGVNVYADISKKHKNSKYNSKVFVKVPVKYDVEFNTMGGEVTLKNISGELSGKTMGGELKFSDLGGNVNCQTMGGEIALVKCNLNGKVKTMGGDINLENVEGNLNIETMGGEIHQKNVTLKEGKSGDNSLTIKTMGGDIEVDKVLTESNISTMGGNININAAKKNLKVSTMGGNIEVGEMDGEIAAKTMGGNISVNLKSCPENGDVEITTMAGNIDLIVPADFGMKIQINVRGINTEDVSDYVESDFKLNYDFDDDDELTATGVVGNGSRTVTLSTNYGKVSIKKK
ncbi:MAG: hypothetical protein V1773_18955 [bacterium]